MLHYNNDEINLFRKAGQIAGKARDYGLSLIRPGASLLDVSLAVEEKIRSLGGEPAFPAQISLNHVAAHYCAIPGDPYCFQEGDVAKLDVGAHVDGYVGDTAATKNLGGPELLVEASRQALSNALEVIKPDVKVSEVGHAVHSAITSLGYKPVSNLSGHGVGVYKVHGEPQVPNVPEKSKIRFQEGQVVAIEPFATTGGGVVREQGKAEIFSVVGRLKLKKGMDEKVVETIAAYNGLPFARRNLTERFPLKTVNQTLKLLLKKGVLYGYAPLTEKGGVLISQAEHTVYVGDTLEILTLVE